MVRKHAQGVSQSTNGLFVRGKYDDMSAVVGFRVAIALFAGFLLSSKLEMLCPYRFCCMSSSPDKPKGKGEAETVQEDGVDTEKQLRSWRVAMCITLSLILEIRIGCLRQLQREFDEQEEQNSGQPRSAAQQPLSETHLISLRRECSTNAEPSQSISSRHSNGADMVRTNSMSPLAGRL